MTTSRKLFFHLPSEGICARCSDEELVFLSSIPHTGSCSRPFPLKFPGETGAEEKGDAGPLLYEHRLSSLPPIWFMHPLGEEDESHPPPASSWQPAKAGPAWWDAPLGPGRCLSCLLRLPGSVSLEQGGGAVQRNSPFSAVFSLPQLHPRGRHRVQQLKFFIQAAEVGWFVFSLEDGV